MRRTVLIATIAALSLAACGSSDADSEPSTSEAETATESETDESGDAENLPHGKLTLGELLLQGLRPSPNLAHDLGCRQ